GFLAEGGGMIPMPVFGLHWVVYATFMAAIASGLLADHLDPLLRGLLLYSGVSAAGPCMYYVGRAPEAVLVAAVFPAWAFCLMLLVQACYNDWKLQQPIGSGPVRVPVGSAVLCLIFGVGTWQALESPDIAGQIQRCASIGGDAAPDPALVQLIRR